MTCMKITESQNGQIYPEDKFSHGVAHLHSGYLPLMKHAGLSCDHVPFDWHI